MSNDLTLSEPDEAGVVQVTVYPPTLTDAAQAARHVLYVLEGDTEYGEDPGHFTSLLIQTMAHADPDNTRRLTVLYGGLMVSVNIYKTKSGGVDFLRRLASKTPDTHPGAGSSLKGN